MLETQAINDTDAALLPRRNGQARLRCLDDLDQRTRAARRAQSLVTQIEIDLGGANELSTAQRELVKRAALLGAIVEDQEARWLERKPADLSLYGTLVDRQRRILETLGIERRARDITPHLINKIRRGDL